MRVSNQNNLKLTTDLKTQQFHSKQLEMQTKAQSPQWQTGFSYSGAEAVRNIRLAGNINFGTAGNPDFHYTAYRIEIKNLFDSKLWKDEGSFQVEVKKDGKQKCLFINGENKGNGFKIETGPYTFSTSRTSDGVYPKITVTDKDNKVIAEIAKKSENLPEIIMEFGKFTPTCVIIDKSNKNEKYPLACLIKDGTLIDGKDFGLKMDTTGKFNSDISFKGSAHFTTAHLPEATAQTVKEYFMNNMFQHSEKGDYVDELNALYEADPEKRPKAVITVGGFGSRFEDLSGINEDSKPTKRFPAENWKLLHIAALDMAVRGGIIDPKKIRSEIKLAERFHRKSAKVQSDVNHLLRDYKHPANNISFSIEEEKPLGTAGGVVLGIRNGEIPSHRPIVVCNGDAFSNIDLSKALKKFANTNAGLMLVGYPVEKERLKSFGIMGFETIDGNNEITKFIEKPDPKKADELKEAEAGLIKNENDPYYGKYYANIATYIMSPEITNILEQIAPENESYDFGFNFLPLMMRILNTKEPISVKDIPVEDKSDTKEQQRIYEKLIKLKLIDDNGVPQPVYPVKASFDENYNLTAVPDESKKPLKMVVYPAEGIQDTIGYWNDIGSTEAYIKEMRELASNPAKYHGMPKDFIDGIKENVKDGIVFIPEMVNTGVNKGENSRILREEKFENFKKAYGISKITGEIIVTEKLPAKQVI